MIILNSCTNVKVQFTDSQPRKMFSMLVLNKEEQPDLCLFDDILVDKKTASFLREFPFEWLESEDKEQLYGVRVEADKQACREFLKEHLSSDGKILLDDE